MFLKYLCEFLGTMMLILLGDGVVANVTLNKSGMKGAGSIQITIAWGLAVMVPAFSASIPASRIRSQVVPVATILNPSSAKPLVQASTLR